MLSKRAAQHLPWGYFESVPRCCLSLQVQQVSPMPTSFLGSALRGTFFLIFGLWWSVRYTLKYLGRKANAENQPSYGVQRMEFFEGAVKAFFALAGKR